MDWKVGDVRITKVVEHELPVPLNGLLNDPPVDATKRYPWLAPDFVFDDENARLSIHGLVVDTGDRRILVDTCVGEGRDGLPMPPPDVNFVEALAAAGYPIDDIDTVLCTHLHFDHVGWNTRLVDGRWVPTFPHARYLFGRVEWEHWQVTTGNYINVDDTVRPVVEAGLAELVETDHVLCDQVRLVPTPGHTPGHCSVVIESGGERAIITGDMAHHPVQFAEPDLGMDADTDSVLAAATRRTFLTERVADGALVIGTHFGGRTAGHVVADGTGWRFDL
jgi:glyoxylase-like metal-dependent hydrolase (beta-lactamase superfamily II)